MQQPGRLRENCIFSQIDDRLVFFLCSADQATSLLPCRFRNAHIIPEIKDSDSDEATGSGRRANGDGLDFHPMSLASLYRFSVILVNALRRTPNQMIIVCGGREPQTSTNTALLLGGFLVLCHDHEPEVVEQSFRPSSYAFVPYYDHLTLIDCWRALAHCRQTPILCFTIVKD